MSRVVGQRTRANRVDREWRRAVRRKRAGRSMRRRHFWRIQEHGRQVQESSEKSSNQSKGRQKSQAKRERATWPYNARSSSRDELGRDGLGRAAQAASKVHRRGH